MDFDILLQRTILYGSEYDALIPKTLCKGTSIGNGDTDFSLRKMKEVIEKFNFQTEKIAHKFQKPTIEATVAAIKDFVYNHFQYRADTDVQFIRTPSCSWYQRHSGIDCKSYSIIASSILSNLDIPHALRKIKQPGYNPTSWTHVYVVIPDTTDNDNYYVIDGTLPEDEEPLFIDFKDLDIMKHEMLNGAADGGNSGQTWEQIYKGIGYAEQATAAGSKGGKLLDLKNMRGRNFVEKLLNAAKCFNAAFPPKPVAGRPAGASLQEAITRIQEHFENLAIRINEALSRRDMVQFNKTVAELRYSPKMFFDAYRKKQQDDYHACTNANINVAVDALYFYETIGVAALDAWLNTYFVSNGTNGNIKMNSNDYLGIDHFFFSFNSVPIYVDKPVTAYTTKPLSYDPIKAFVLTRYLGEVNNTSEFDAAKFLGGINQVAASFQNQNSQNQGTINPATGQPYPSNIQDFNSNGGLPPQKASMNVLGMLLIAGAAVYGVKEFSKENKTKQSK